MAKNAYTNIANIIAPLSELQGEAVPKSTAFASITGENIVFEMEGILKYPVNLTSLTAQPLNEFTRHVLGVIGSYEFVTTKMITDILNLFGIPADSKHTLNACERLRKTGLIHSFRFMNEGGDKASMFIVHTISKLAGENALKSLGVSVTQVDSYNVVMDPVVVKKKLATNQILLAYMKRNAVIGFEKSKRISVIDNLAEEHIAVRPSLTLIFRDQSSIFYEVVRKSIFWKTELENKLIRYKAVQENWGTTAKEKMPALILCGENEEHVEELCHMASSLGLNCLFTHDLLFFSSNFNQHLLTLNDDGEAVYFKISFNEEDSKEAC